MTEKTMTPSEIDRLYEKADLTPEELSSLWTALMERLTFLRECRLGVIGQEIFTKYISMLDDVEKEMEKVEKITFEGLH